MSEEGAWGDEGRSGWRRGLGQALAGSSPGGWRKIVSVCFVLGAMKKIIAQTYGLWRMKELVVADMFVSGFTNLKAGGTEALGGENIFLSALPADKWFTTETDGD